MAGSEHVWEFIWCIDEISEKGSVDETLFGAKFSKFPESCPIKWEIFLELVSPQYTTNRHVFPNIEPHDGIMTIVFERKDLNRRNVTVLFSYKMRDFYKREYIANVAETTLAGDCKKYSFRPVYKPKPYTDLLTQDKLWIEGSIRVQNCCSSGNLDKVLGSGVTQLMSDYRTLLSKSDFVDVVFQIKDKKMYAHKCVLSARSPIFYEMFKNSVRNQEIHIVDVPHIEEPVLSAFLCFIYSGSLDDIETETVMKLYPLAVLYEIETLRKLCSARLILHLSSVTACNSWKLALKYTDNDLKFATMVWFFNHFSEVEVAARNEIAESLHLAAVENKIGTLRQACCGLIASRLSVDTACDIWILGVERCDPILRSIALNWICGNFPEVQKTQRWIEVRTTNPSLSSSVYNMLYKIKK